MKKNYVAVCLILLVIVGLITPTILAKEAKNLLNDTLVVGVQTDKKIYLMGEPVRISIYVENIGATNITIVFPSTQKADFSVNDCYLWSQGKVFDQILIPVTIPSGKRVYLLNDTWDQVDHSGDQVSPGTYAVKGWMVETSQFPQIHAPTVTIRIGSQLDVQAHGGFGFTVYFTDTGAYDITNLTGFISVNGGLFGRINLTESFMQETLRVNESIVKTFHPIGVGPLHLEIRVLSSNTEEIYMYGRMTVVFLIVYPIIPPLEVIINSS